MSPDVCTRGCPAGLLFWIINFSSWARTIHNVEPDLAAFGHGLLGMNEDDSIAESFGKNADKLAGEGDFGDEENGGFLRFEGISGHFEVNIGFATTGNAAEEFSTLRRALEGLESFLLRRVERDEGQFKQIWRIWALRGVLSGF